MQYWGRGVYHIEKYMMSEVSALVCSKNSSKSSTHSASCTSGVGSASSTPKDTISHTGNTFSISGSALSMVEFSKALRSASV